MHCAALVRTGRLCIDALMYRADAYVLRRSCAEALMH